MGWTEYCCICTEICGLIGWLSQNNPDNVSFFGRTEGIDYLILKLLKDQENETPDVKIKAMPKRMSFSMGLGKVEHVYNVTSYVNRRLSGDEKGSAISKFNKVKQFQQLHDEMSDTPVYFIERVRNVDDDGWDYNEHEDDQGNTDRKYLKGKVAGIVKNYQTYGYIEYTLQFMEAWQP